MQASLSVVPCAFAIAFSKTHVLIKDFSKESLGTAITLIPTLIPLKKNTLKLLQKGLRTQNSKILTFNSGCIAM